MPEIKEDQLKRFLQELMNIQRTYANEEKNKKSNRQAEIKEMLDRFVAKEFKNDH